MENKKNDNDKIIENSNEERKVKKKVTTKVCNFCGEKLRGSDRFCTKCGKDVNLKPIKIEEKPKKEQTPKSVSMKQFVIFSSIITFVMCAILTFVLVNVLDGENTIINTGNKNVTVDDTGIADSVSKVYDSVVVVENYVNGKLFATGSGFVYNTDNKYGYILTNSHVLSNATEAYVRFTDKEKVKVELVGSDEFSDVAVLKVAKKYVKQVAITGKNSDMRIGDTTFAIGAPLDSDTYSWSVTRGVLSGKDRVVSSSTSYMTVLQTDTPINSGNSGGPLCNANGEVIGITNMKLASDQIEGMGFAIPIETALEYAEQFVSGKEVRHPYIGVAIYDGTTSFFGGDVNVVIESVEKNSPADKAGIKAGDIITEVEGEKVENSAYFKYKLYSYKVGDKVKITVTRDGKEKTFTVKLTSNSKSA